MKEDRYRININEKNGNKFIITCEESDLERHLAKHMESLEEGDIMFYRKFPLTESEKVYVSK